MGTMISTCDYCEDSETVLSRQQAIHEARRRMQEQFDAQAAHHAEEMKKVNIQCSKII